MSTEANKEILRRYYEHVLNGGKTALLDELAVPTYEEHDPMPGQGTGLEGLKDRVKMFLEGLSPHFTIEDMIAEGEKVVVRWTNSGTHVGEFFGIPPTQKSFQIAGIDIHRLQAGRMAEHWHVVDVFGMLQQLGVLQPPGAEA
jgi:predicted ester cyclase